jgi:hypothetical protein
MNVFEELIVELKKENLLEETVVELDQQTAVAPRSFLDADLPRPDFDLPPPVKPDDETLKSGFEMTEVLPTPSPIPEAETTEETVEEDIESPAESYQVGEAEKSSGSEKEFFRKRAVNEISGLQMVEHVFTGVEREYMKVLPSPFDDIAAKKALHTLVNVTGEPDSDEHKAAQSMLLQETEAWGMALTERDRKISVANLRLYCENSQPALSSQALLALARFYRNAPFSETVRAKFDFVITRLFSRPGQDEARVSLFTRDETVKHLTTLYGEWSSIPLYLADDDESKLLLTGLSFDDLSMEAEGAVNFDQLTQSDFFGRLRLFKESISELFYAPTVTAAAIESNVRIGNAYVRLIRSERNKLDATGIEAKCGDLDLQSVSDTTGRTLDVADLVRQRTKEGKADKKEGTDRKASSPRRGSSVVSKRSETERSSIAGSLGQSTRRVNRWLVITAVSIFLLTIGLYLWADFFVAEKVSTAGVQKINVEHTSMGEYIQTARISNETFYGLLLPVWDGLPKDRREDILKKLYEDGKEKGYRQVTLINKEGKQAGFASDGRLDVIMP